MTRSRRLAGALAGVAASFLVVSGCGPEQGVIDQKIWRCDPAVAASDECGTSNGKPMTCYSAAGLGGWAVCTETCDPAVGSPDPANFFCTAAGALLRRCNPGTHVKTCPQGLSCYRTELNPIGDDDGLCLPLAVCANAGDCAGQGARSECASALLEENYPDAVKYLATNDLQCVEPCSQSDGTASTCPDGESCFPSFFDDDPVQNVCVPGCAEERPCPPNFYCLADAGRAYPPVCAPGLPGYRCAHSEDCAIGDCRDTGAGFSICAIDCSGTPEICSVLDSPRGPSVCADGMCIIKSPFAGAHCNGPEDCKENEVCSLANFYEPSIPRQAVSAECHLSCNAASDCHPDSVVPYLCIRQEDAGECYPADFGLPCMPGVDTCMGELECLPSTVEDGGQGTCTRRCESDGDCAAYNLSRNGWCNGGVCRLHRLGDPCSDDKQCTAGTCMNGTCR